MVKSFFETSTYHRAQAWRALGFMCVSILGLSLSFLYGPEDPFRYILGLILLASTSGFISHRRKAKKLDSVPSAPVRAPTEKG